MFPKCSQISAGVFFALFFVAHFLAPSMAMACDCKDWRIAAGGMSSFVNSECMSVGYRQAADPIDDRGFYCADFSGVVLRGAERCMVSRVCTYANSCSSMANPDRSSLAIVFGERLPDDEVFYWACFGGWDVRIPRRPLRGVVRVAVDAVESCLFG
jgi:hypothetical protein